MGIFILRSLQELEDRFSTGVITPVLIESVAMYEVMRQLPDILEATDVATFLDSETMETQ